MPKPILVTTGMHASNSHDQPTNQSTLIATWCFAHSLLLLIAICRFVDQSQAWGFSEPMFVPPYVQLVGSMFDPEITPSEPMTKDLRRWLDNADKPVIYISTGTNVRLLEHQLTSLVCTNQSRHTYTERERESRARCYVADSTLRLTLQTHCNTSHRIG
jgi:hypothetical protein